jgi:hypothetical protein
VRLDQPGLEQVTERHPEGTRRQVGFRTDPVYGWTTDPASS